jgi:hypothetical protein
MAPLTRSVKKAEPVLTDYAVKVDKEIVTVDINKVKLWKDNPRRNDAAAPKLAEVIKERGQVTPVVVWRKDGVCYKGNTTIKALKLLGEKTVDVLFADFKSEASAIAYGIADNKSSEFSEWDDTLLLSFLKMDDVKTTGFTSSEIGFFDTVEMTVEKIPAIETVIAVFKLFGKTSLDILNFVKVQNGILHATNLDFHVTIPVDAPDGIYDLRLFEHVRKWEFCKRDVPVSDYPNVPTDGFIKAKIDLSGLEKFIPFTLIDTSRAILHNVCFSDGIVFGTNGHVGLSEPRKAPSDFSISSETAKILSLFDLGTAYLNDEWIKADAPDGVTVYIKICKDRAPDYKKAINKIDVFYPVNRIALLEQVKKLIPFAKTQIEFISDRIQNGVVASAFENPITFSGDIDNFVKVLSAFPSETVEIGISLSGTQVQIKNENLTAIFMVLRKAADVKFDAPIVFPIGKPEEPEIMESFSARGFGYTINGKCLRTIKADFLNKVGFKNA